MTATKIDDLVTPVSIPALAGALLGGYPLVMGDGQTFRSAKSFAAALAQLLLESGNGQKNHNFNFGNEKLSAAWEGLYCQFTCDEIFDARMTALARTKGPCGVALWKGGPNNRVILSPPHPWSSFIAFENADQGAARYIEFLSCSDRYKAAWHALLSGDAAAFSHELRRAGYYTADEDVYTKGLVSIATRSLPMCDALLAKETPLFTAEQANNITSLGNLIIADTMWMHDRHHEELAA